MRQATLHLHQLLQTRQVDGSGDDHLVGRITFDVEVDREIVATRQVAHVKTAAGGGTDSEIEVYLDHGYDGPALKHDDLSRCMATYYRQTAFRVPPGVSALQEENIFEREARCEGVGLGSDSGAW